MLKTLSKSKKIIIGASIAGAVGIGAAVVVPLSLRKTKSESVGTYDEFTKQILKNLSPEPYRLWKANADKALEALNKTQIGNIDIPDHYALLGMFQRPKFNVNDSEMRFIYQNQKSGQMVDLVIDVNVKDALSNFEVAIEYGRVNNIDLGKVAIERANEILLRDNGAAEAAQQKREEDIATLQSLASDENIKPSIAAEARLLRSSELEVDSLVAPAPRDGFKFTVEDVLNENSVPLDESTALSSGEVDVVMKISQINPVGVPLERTVVRHIQTVSNTQAISDIPAFIEHFIDGLKDYDISFAHDMHHYLPSQVKLDEMQKNASVIIPKSQTVFSAKITNIFSAGEKIPSEFSFDENKAISSAEKLSQTDDSKGTLDIGVTITPSDDLLKADLAMERHVVLHLSGFKTSNNLTQDQINEMNKQRMLRIIQDEKNELDQEKIRGEFKGASDQFFLSFPSGEEAAIPSEKMENVNYQTLSKYGFPPSITLNYGLFDYKYYVDEVKQDGPFYLNIVATLKPNVDKDWGNSKIEADKREFYSRFEIKAQGMAEAKAYNDDVQKLAEKQQEVNKAFEDALRIGAGIISFKVDEDILPSGKREIDQMVIPLNPDSPNDPEKALDWLQSFYNAFTSPDKNDQSVHRRFDYEHYNYNLIFGNSIETNGRYKISIEVTPKGRMVAPKMDALPKQYDADFSGMDELLVKREVDFIKAELAKMTAAGIHPSRTFSYKEINPEAFDDRSSIYSGFYFDSSKITVPGVRNIPLTASVLQQFGIPMQTTGDPRISFTFSHDEISNESLSNAQDKDVVIYTIQVHRGNYVSEDAPKWFPDPGVGYSIKIPVKINDFESTIRSIRQDELSQYVEKVLNDPKQTPHPIQIYSLIDKIQWNDEHYKDVWYVLDTSLDSMDVSFDGHNKVTDQFGFDITDAAVTGRFFTWLKTFGIITDNRVSGTKMKANTLLIRIDPVPNTDGTYNVELRVGSSTIDQTIPYDNFQEGVNTNIVIKANLVNLNEGKVYIEDHKFDELAKYNPTTQAWSNPALKNRVTASIVDSVDPFKMTLSTSEQLVKFINLGLNVDTSLFNIREFDYDIALEKRIDINEVRAAQNGLPVQVKITPRLKTHPEIVLQPTTVWVDVAASPANIYGVSFDRAGLTQEFQSQIIDNKLFNVHRLGRLTNNQLLNFDQNDEFTGIYLQDAIDWLKNKFGTLPEYTHVLPGMKFPVYRYSSIWEKDPNVKNGFIITIIATPQYDMTTQIIIPSFTLTGKLVVNEHPNSIKSYLGGYVDLNGVRHETRGVMPFASGTTLTSPIPIPENFREIRNDVVELNKYLPTGRRIPHLMDGYIYARKEGDRIVVGIYRDSRIADDNKVYEFFIGKPNAATPFAAPQPDLELTELYA